MSLEKSMQELAESNNKLAEAQNNLAEAQNNVASQYQEMIAFFAANGVPASASADKPASSKPEAKGETAAQRKKREAAEAEAAAAAAKGSGDGFDDDDASGESTATELTADDVKKKLFEVKDKFGDKSFALEIIAEYGYKALPDIQEKDFDAIYADAEKALKRKK